MQGDSREVRRLYLPNIRYLIFDNILQTDKMTDFNFILADNGRQKICICQKKAILL